MDLGRTEEQVTRKPLSLTLLAITGGGKECCLVNRKYPFGKNDIAPERMLFLTTESQTCVISPDAFINRKLDAIGEPSSSNSFKNGFGNKHKDACRVVQNFRSDHACNHFTRNRSSLFFSRLVDRFERTSGDLRTLRTKKSMLVKFMDFLDILTKSSRRGYTTNAKP